MNVNEPCLFEMEIFSNALYICNVNFDLLNNFLKTKSYWPQSFERENSYTFIYYEQHWHNFTW